MAAWLKWHIPQDLDYKLQTFVGISKIAICKIAVC